MVHWAAINCTKSSTKRNDNTFSFAELLKDPRRRKNLIAKLKQANLLKDKNLHVCHKHWRKLFSKRFESKFYFLGCLVVSKICSWAHISPTTFYFNFKMKWIFLKSSFCVHNLIFLRIKEITSEQEQWV